MNIRVFELERVQSLYENTVDYNLTESGFHPYKLNELLTADQLTEIENTVLGYGQTNGSVQLRKRIADCYPGCTENNVLVTNGSSEANFVACHTLLEKGDEVVMMVPNYMQINGIAEEMGFDVHFFHLLVLEEWLQMHNDLFHLIPPKAGGMAFIRYNLNMNSTLLAEMLRKEKSVFIIAGDIFGIDKYLRIGIGAEKSYLTKGLELLSDFLAER